MLSITPIPAFTDNYIWCLHNGSEAFVVDPGAAAPVEAFLSAHTLQLRGLLITHHHPDHTGGIKELTTNRPNLPVYGPDNPRIDGITHTLREGDVLTALGQAFQVIEVPGHTLDHIAFFADTAPQPLLFCGDTLFAAGCGRLFEGTPAQMFSSLQKLTALPAQTLVYCTHEYTQSNLRFARAVEPDNADIAARADNVEVLRARQQVTLPSSIAMELATNPFLRWQAPAVQAAARTRNPEASSGPEIFAAIRGWKDQF